MRAALAAGIGAFNVESAEELVVLDRVARAAGTRARISLRVNPDVDPRDPSVHLDRPQAEQVRRRDGRGARAVSAAPRSSPGLDVVGVDCHIGSQLTKTAPFTDAIARLVALVERAREPTASSSATSISAAASASTTARATRTPPSPAEYGVAVRTALAPLAALGVTLVHRARPRDRRRAPARSSRACCIASATRRSTSRSSTRR